MRPREASMGHRRSRRSIRVAPDDLILAPFLGPVQRAVLEVAHADGRAVGQRVFALRLAVDMAVKPVHAQHRMALLQVLLEIRTPSHPDLRYPTRCFSLHIHGRRSGRPPPRSTKPHSPPPTYRHSIPMPFAARR